MIKKSVCKVCGKEFEYEAIGGRLKRYCSDKCKKIIINKRALEKYKREYVPKPAKPRKFNPITRTCQECGKEFQQIRPDVNGIFCSRSCHMRWESKHKALCNQQKATSNIPLKWVYQGICPVCGKNFETHQEKQKYCSSECAYKESLIKQKREKLLNFVPELRICKECGNTFETKLHEQNRLFCCNKCASKYWNRVAKTNKNVAIRGAKVFDRNISLKKLAERDNNICYLCGASVDWNDKEITAEGHTISGPNYPSIEHVIPVSRGGTHSWDNVRLAHRRCNSAKHCKTANEYKCIAKGDF